MKYGYIETQRPLSEALQQLRAYIDELPKRLQAFSEEELTDRNRASGHGKSYWGTSSTQG